MGSIGKYDTQNGELYIFTKRVNDVYPFGMRKKHKFKTTFCRFAVTQPQDIVL